MDNNRVWDMVEGRSTENARDLLETLSEEQKTGVKAVAMDRWAAYENAVKEQLPNAEIVHDKFHISAYLNKAVDDVRKEEHRRLMSEGDDTLKNSKFQWRHNFPDLRCEPAFQSLVNGSVAGRRGKSEADSVASAEINLPLLFLQSGSSIFLAPHSCRAEVRMSDAAGFFGCKDDAVGFEGFLCGGKRIVFSGPSAFLNARTMILSAPPGPARMSGRLIRSKVLDGNLRASTQLPL